MKKTPLVLAMLACLTQMPRAFAEDLTENPNADMTAAPEVDLGTQQVVIHRKQVSSLALGDTQKASDVSVSKAKLQQRSATLGNALSGELGIHSNPFGGGASAPVVRGQEGVRVKVLQNSADVVDVSSISPDHVIAADTLLAQRVDVVRGASTLLYSAASPAGVINIVDGRIPTQMPTGALMENAQGETLLRYNANNDEKVATASIAVGIGEHLAVRAEGLTRRSDEYKVPHFQADTPLTYLPGSQNRSTVGTLGISYIHDDDSYIGASYSQRRDNYHIPGHIHCYSDREHFTKWYGSSRYYLPIYPHLMDDDDIADNPHTHCQHTHSEPSVANPTGVLVDHTHDTPWIDMTSKRIDVRGQWQQPIQGIERLKFSFTHADYYHDEKDPGNQAGTSNTKTTERDSQIDKGSANAIFTNKGTNARLELYHTPTERFSGLLGVQYQTQKTQAGEVLLPSYFESSQAYQDALRNNVNRYKPYLLVPNTNKNFSVFALETLKLGKATIEAGVRYEQQKTPVHYENDLLAHAYDRFKNDQFTPNTVAPTPPDLSTYRQNALSYSGTLLWNATPDTRLSLTYSHNERIPSPMELYYQGRHLATSSFEHGNKNLTKEKSDNYEIGIAHSGEKFSYKASAYFNDFDNYIFNENIAKEGNLYLRHYNQTTAKFYGLEGELNYRINDTHRLTVFGDVVRGKLGALSDVVGKNFYDTTPIIDEDNIDSGCLLQGGDLSRCITFLNDFVTPPIVELDPDCSREDIEDAPEICILTYPAKVGTDTLARPATNAPRVPPARLGFRWEADVSDNWRFNVEFTKVFAQKRVATSTIAIKPELRTPAGCDRGDDCQIDYYPNNSLPMQPRFVVENKTAGYHLLNLGLDYNNQYRDIDYTLSLRANNLLNEQIYIHNSFLPFVPQMGRNFSVSLTTKF